MDQKELDVRLQRLKLKVAEDKITKIEEQNLQRKQAEALTDAIHELQPRIQKLLLLANAMKENGIAFPEKNEMKNFGYPSDALAESFYHGVGFMGRQEGENAFRNNPILHVGFYNGGACGKFNFYTDGNEVFELHEDWSKLARTDPGRRTDPFRPATIGSMMKFLKNYFNFESSFLKWFDMKMTLNNPERESEYEKMLQPLAETELEDEEEIEL